MDDGSKPGIFSPLDGNDARQGTAQQAEPRSAGWFPILPVPENAPPSPQEHYKRGRPVAIYTYRGPEGALLGYVCRFDADGGNKEFLPLTYCENAGDGKREWRWRGFTAPRPLYNLARLHASPQAPVVVCEGEKAANAAGKLLTGWVGITSPGGSNAAHKADWSVLAGRRVVIWPDADEPGIKYARVVAKTVSGIGAQSVAIVTPSPDTGAGWDAADALADGWDSRRCLDLVEVGQVATDVAAGGRKRRPPQRENLVALLEDAEFWHSTDGEAFVTLPIKDYFVNWPVRSRLFKTWLSGRFFEIYGFPPGGQALEDALRVMKAKAIHRGPEHRTYLRIGYHAGAVFVDLGGPDWRAVEITADGWKVVVRPPIKFVRSPHMRPLPVPKCGGSVDLLRDLINYGDEELFKLIVGWLVGAFNPDGPYPILIIGGEQGSAKSSLTRALRSLTDPNEAPIRSVPRDERDLVISAKNARILAYDNLSGMPAWLSDALSRLSTGGGFGGRQLFTDMDEVVFSGQRPIILNGIGDLASKPDMADRAIAITLPAIPEDKRRTEREWERAFEDAAPFILGAVMDAVSAALRRLPQTKLDGNPRMADFATWVAAAEMGLGWEDGSFLPIYLANREEAVQTSLESDLVAQEILKLVKRQGHWEGSATELLAELDSHVSEAVKSRRTWPKNPSMVSKRLTQAAPLLRAEGVEIERWKGGPDSKRLIIIRPRSTEEG